jgi:hypothetical protein
MSRFEFDVSTADEVTVRQRLLIKRRNPKYSGVIFKETHPS